MQDDVTHSEIASTFSPGTNSSSSKNRARKSPEPKILENPRLDTQKLEAKSTVKVKSFSVFFTFHNVISSQQKNLQPKSQDKLPAKKEKAQKLKPDKKKQLIHISEEDEFLAEEHIPLKSLTKKTKSKVNLLKNDYF